MANIRPLSPELAEAARVELFEDPQRIEADLQHLREWLSKQPHLHARTDDQFLVTFLRGCKYSLERTKEKLDAFYTMRTALPEFYSKRDPMAPAIQEILRLGLMVPLPCVDPEGRRVMMGRFAKFDPNKVNINDFFKANMMINDLLMEEDDTLIIKGQVGLMDVANFGVAHATQVTPSLAKKSATVFQEAYPIRPKAMHYLNVSSIFETIFNLFKSFLKEKLRKRIFLHSGMETVYPNIPKEILPKEYGGTGESIDVLAERWKKKMEENRQFFLEEEKYYCDESKRPGKPKTHEDLFGLEGSFRPLNVD